MRTSWRAPVPCLVGWAALSAAGALLRVRVDIAQRRDAFQAEARAAHRLLGGGVRVKVDNVKDLLK